MSEHITPIEASTLYVQAYQALRRSVAGILQEFLLDPRRWSILTALAAHSEGLSYQEVAASLQVEPALITMRSKELIEARLLTTVKRENDFRSKYLQLTSDGQALMIAVNARLNANLEKVVAGIDEATLQAHFLVLKTIIQNAE